MLPVTTMRNLVTPFCLNLLWSLVLLQPAAPVLAQDAARTGIEELLHSQRHPYLLHDDLSAELPTLQALYQARNYQPLWFRQERPTPQALALLEVLRDAASRGLRARDYEGTTLTYRLTELAALQGDAAGQSRAQLEVGLSVAALRFIRHLHYGRIDPRRVGFDLAASRTGELDLLVTLNTLAMADDVPARVNQLEPQLVHFQLLKAALARYRLLAVDAELTQLPAFTARALRPGEAYVGAAALRRLLVAEQDLPAAQMLPDSDTSLDPALVAALQKYQVRHGLQADGTLGRQTFIALTTPFARRVEQIELTLERWRWLPALHAPVIVVNIPQFRLFAFNAADDREATLLRMDVIVGQTFPHTQTPVFLADLKYVVFRPYWDVPRDIVKREMLAVIQRDPGYLQRNELELVQGQGDAAPVVSATPENFARLTTGSVRLRQRPGPNNALGEVKFMLPNRYNVYLHSTPARQLFSQSRRAFSHGCIRVSDPVALAEYILRYAPGTWRRQEIQAAMQGSPNQRVNLNLPIPVLIVYGTVMANEAGQVQFFDDLYGHDRTLAKLL